MSTNDECIKFIVKAYGQKCSGQSECDIRLNYVCTDACR